MKNLRLPTILGLLVVGVWVFVGFLFEKNSELSTSIKADVAKPKKVEVSNISDSSVAVSWESDISANFVLTWYKRQSLLDDYSIKSTGMKKVHYIEITNLEPGTTYEFQLARNGIKYEGEPIAWKFTTLKKIGVLPAAKIVSGKVVDSSGLPVADAIIFVSTDTKEMLTTISDKEGSFFVNLSHLINSSGIPVNINDASILAVTVKNSEGLTSTGTVQVKSANSMPDIVIGKNFDYTYLPPDDKSLVPEATID